MKYQEYVDVLARELSAQGVVDWDVDDGHNHPRLVFRWNGAVIKFVMPGTPSDRFGIQNAVSQLRQMMGVKRIIHKSANTKPKLPPAKKKETFISLSGLSFIVKPNPLLALADMKVRVLDAIKEARWAGRIAHYSGLCGQAPENYPDHLAKAFLLGWQDGMWQKPG